MKKLPSNGWVEVHDQYLRENYLRMDDAALAAGVKNIQPSRERSTEAVRARLIRLDCFRPTRKAAEKNADRERPRIERRGNITVHRCF